MSCPGPCTVAVAVPCSNPLSAGAQGLSLPRPMGSCRPCSDRVPSLPRCCSCWLRPAAWSPGPCLGPAGSCRDRGAHEGSCLTAPRPLPRASSFSLDAQDEFGPSWLGKGPGDATCTTICAGFGASKGAGIVTPTPGRLGGHRDCFPQAGGS